jgi:hypothetical protein
VSMYPTNLRQAPADPPSTSLSDRCSPPSSSSTSARSTPSSSPAGCARPRSTARSSRTPCRSRTCSPRTPPRSSSPAARPVVYAAGAPSLDPALLAAGVPVFGMCYGFQAMAQALGGTVAHTGRRVRPPRLGCRHGLDALRRPAGRAVGVDEPRRLGHGRPGGDAVTASTAGRRSRPSRTTNAGSMACSGTRRCCTRHTGSGCWRTSSGAARAGRRLDAGQRRRGTRRAVRAQVGRVGCSVRCPAGSTRRSRRRSCSGPSATS